MISSLITSAILSLVPFPIAEEGELPDEPITATIHVLADRVDFFEPGEEPEPLHPSIAETYAQRKCVQWIDTALEAGWQPEDMPRLMRIMWRESRCLPDACGETDSPHLRKCRDWGLMQINDYSWKRIIREMGWHIEQMHDPLENLRFARWLFEYSLERNGDGWVPWKFPAK